jgi:hypothetical protein
MFDHNPSIQEARIELAEYLAILDGCEGGDYLNVLASALSMANYTYTGREDYHEQVFDTLLVQEMEVHIQSMKSGEYEKIRGKNLSDEQWDKLNNLIKKAEF